MPNGDIIDPGQDRRPIPMAQRFFDDIFLMLVLGLVTPFLIYVVWGLVDVGSVPAAPYLH